MNLLSEPSLPSLSKLEVPLPKTAEGVISNEELKVAYETDQELLDKEEQLAMVLKELEDIKPMFKELKEHIAKLNRNRTTLIRRGHVLHRMIHNRKKLLIQKIFDTHLMSIRKKLGLGKPNVAQAILRTL